MHAPHWGLHEAVLHANTMHPHDAEKEGDSSQKARDTLAGRAE
jgi:hypothetical protein